MRTATRSFRLDAHFQGKSVSSYCDALSGESQPGSQRWPFLVSLAHGLATHGAGVRGQSLDMTPCSPPISICRSPRWVSFGQR
eukprot:scaffold56841_cov30-Tisochrysis_lutea.AAC.5